MRALVCNNGVTIINYLYSQLRFFALLISIVCKEAMKEAIKAMQFVKADMFELSIITE